jgi:hypothetical protein
MDRLNITNNYFVLSYTKNIAMLKKIILFDSSKLSNTNAFEIVHLISNGKNVND